tara:strand:+ start:972 stop:1871 length:900 start_codon:yes stop_codon:yes gene_type:complete
MGLISQTQQAYYGGTDIGDYQFTSLSDIISNFTAAFVGGGKILQNVNRADISFHAHRALAELSFDTLKSCKSQEITLPPSLQMLLPQDYVSYTKVSWVDSKGVKHLLYPTSKTSNPLNPNQNADGTFDFDHDDDGNTTDAGEESLNYTDSDTWASYQGGTIAENTQGDYQDDIYWRKNGSRFGLDPQHAQSNGSFYIDCVSGKIHFSSNVAGKTVVLDYLSDSLGTDGEMQVHKFAEEAVYKWIAYGCLIAKLGVPEYVINRFKKEKIAETRKAKIRLSNIKIEEITQVLRGRSKWIKH